MVELDVVAQLAAQQWTIRGEQGGDEAHHSFVPFRHHHPSPRNPVQCRRHRFLDLGGWCTRSDRDEPTRVHRDG